MENNELFAILARMGQALANPSRLKLLYLLTQCERSVESLAAAAGEPMGSVSHHLQRLKSVQLVRGKKRGRQVIYGLADKSVALFWTQLRAFAEARMSDLCLETTSLTEARRQAGAVNRGAYQDLVERRGVIVVDVRPREEYEAGHLPGSISIPYSELSERLDELPHEDDFIVYCRGPYCVLADKAVELLVGLGRKARRMMDGVAEWEAAGNPVRREGDGQDG